MNQPNKSNFPREEGEEMIRGRERAEMPQPPTQDQIQFLWEYLKHIEAKGWSYRDLDSWEVDDDPEVLLGQYLAYRQSEARNADPAQIPQAPGLRVQDTHLILDFPDGSVCIERKEGTGPPTNPAVPKPPRTAPAPLTQWSQPRPNPISGIEKAKQVFHQTLDRMQDLQILAGRPDPHDPLAEKMTVERDKAKQQAAELIASWATHHWEETELSEEQQKEFVRIDLCRDCGQKRKIVRMSMRENLKPDQRHGLINTKGATKSATKNAVTDPGSADQGWREFHCPGPTPVEERKEVETEIVFDDREPAARANLDAMTRNLLRGTRQLREDLDIDLDLDAEAGRQHELMSRRHWSVPEPENTPSSQEPRRQPVRVAVTTGDAAADQGPNPETSQALQALAGVPGVEVVTDLSKLVERFNADRKAQGLEPIEPVRPLPRKDDQDSDTTAEPNEQNGK